MTAERFAHQALSALKPLFASDVELLLGHGNGPQVGFMLTRVEQSLGGANAVTQSLPERPRRVRRNGLTPNASIGTASAFSSGP